MKLYAKILFFLHYISLCSIMYSLSYENITQQNLSFDAPLPQDINLEQKIHALFEKAQTSDFHLNDIQNIINTILKTNAFNNDTINQLVSQNYKILSGIIDEAIQNQKPQKLKQLIHNGFVTDKALFSLGYTEFHFGYFAHAADHLLKMFEEKPLYLIYNNVYTEDYKPLAAQIFIMLKNYYHEYFALLPQKTQEQIGTLINNYLPTLEQLKLYCQDQTKTLSFPLSQSSILLLESLSGVYGPHNLILAQFYREQKNYSKSLQSILYALTLEEWSAFDLLLKYEYIFTNFLFTHNADKIARTAIFYLEQNKTEYQKAAEKVLELCAKKHSLAACCYLLKTTKKPNDIIDLFIQSCSYSDATYLLPTLKKWDAYKYGIALDAKKNQYTFLCWMLCTIASHENPETLTFNAPKITDTLAISSTILTKINLSIAQNLTFICSDENFEHIRRYKSMIEAGYTAPVTIKWIDNVYGLGAFAEKDIECDEMIGEYIGVLTEPSKYSPHYHSEYLLNYPIPAVVIDQGQNVWNITRFINHSNEANTNYLIVFYDNIYHIIITANCAIKQGEQIYSNYGETYWNFRHIKV